MCRASVARLKGGNLLSSPLPTAHRNWHLPKPPLESLQWINIALAKKIKLLKTFISLKHLSPLAKTSDIKSKSNHTVQITWIEVQGIFCPAAWQKEVCPHLTSQKLYLFLLWCTAPQLPHENPCALLHPSAGRNTCWAVVGSSPTSYNPAPKNSKNWSPPQSR